MPKTAVPPQQPRWPTAGDGAPLPRPAGANAPGEASVLWLVERDGRTTRCVVTHGAQQFDLRIEGDGGQTIWQEAFPTYGAVMGRANEGRERLEALGWRAAQPAPARERANGGVEASATPNAWIDDPAAVASPEPWEQRLASQPALLAPPALFAPKCSACGSENVFAMGTLAFAGFRQLWLCAECKRTWKSVRWTKVLLVVSVILLLGICLTSL